MNTAGWNCNKHIACFYIVVAEDFVLFNDTNCKTADIVFINRHKARMFCCFAADKAAAGIKTAFCNAAYNCCNLFRIVFADCYVVKEEQRFCTAAYDVVYTHGYRIDAYCVVLVHKESKFNLCAAAVCAAYKNRFFVALRKFVQTAETAKTVENCICKCFLNAVFHKLNSFVTCCYINTCCCIAFCKVRHKFLPR